MICLGFVTAFWLFRALGHPGMRDVGTRATDGRYAIVYVSLNKVLGVGPVFRFASGVKTPSCKIPQNPSQDFHC